MEVEMSVLPMDLREGDMVDMLTLGDDMRDDPLAHDEYGVVWEVTQETASCVRIDFQHWTYGVPTQKPITILRDLVGEELEQHLKRVDDSLSGSTTIPLDTVKRHLVDETVLDIHERWKEALNSGDLPAGTKPFNGYKSVKIGQIILSEDSVEVEWSIKLNIPTPTINVNGKEKEDG